LGLGGAVRLGFRKELAAIDDAVEREKLFRSMVAKFYQTGKATNIASVLEIDQVIDPIETRHWILRGLDSRPRPPCRETRKRPCVDTWRSSRRLGLSMLNACRSAPQRERRQGREATVGRAAGTVTIAGVHGP
jgi:hypothetical protein